MTDLELNEALVPVVTDGLELDGESAKTLQKAGGGAAAGAIVGAIAGGGDGAAAGSATGAAAGTTWAAIAGGTQLRLEPETLLEFSLERPLTITVK